MRLRNIWELLLHEQKRQALFLLLFVLIGGIFESVGLGMVLPLIGLMTAPETILTNSAAQPVLNWLGNPDSETAFFIVLGVFVGLYFFIAIYRLWLSWHQTAFLIDLRMTTASRLYASYLHQPWSFHLKMHSSGLIQNIIKEVELVAQYGFGGGFNLIRDSIMVLIILAIFLAVSPIGTLSVVILLTPFALGFQRLSKFRTRRWAKKRLYEEGERLKCAQEGIGAVKELQLLGCEHLFYQKFQAHSENLGHISRLQAFMRALPKPIFEILAIASMAIVIITMRLSGKELASIAPVMGLFALGVVRLMPSVTAILASLHGIRYVTPSVEIISRELRNVHHRNAETNVSMPPFRSELELENLVYIYDGAEEPVLKGINIRIPRGSFTAFVGKSGSGKSTLLHIILGLLEPTGGRVKVDGADIKNFVRGWQRQIGYVGQNIVMIDDTLRRNIALGIADSEIDESAIQRAVEAAQLSDFVANSPEGMDMIVGEQGMRISEGEKQRIGIARALYANASVLILDEITSSLDEGTEALIVQLIRQLKEEKTVILVTHRMAMVGACDQIVNLEHGCVVGCSR